MKKLFLILVTVFSLISCSTDDSTVAPIDPSTTTSVGVINIDDLSSEPWRLTIRETEGGDAITLSPDTNQILSFGYFSQWSWDVNIYTMNGTYTGIPPTPINITSTSIDLPNYSQYDGDITSIDPPTVETIGGGNIRVRFYDVIMGMEGYFYDYYEPTSVIIDKLIDAEYWVKYQKEYTPTGAITPVSSDFRTEMKIEDTSPQPRYRLSQYSEGNPIAGGFSSSYPNVITETHMMDYTQTSSPGFFVYDGNADTFKVKYSNDEIHYYRIRD